MFNVGRVLGVGVDLCAIPRMRDQLGNSSFLRRCFTPDELTWLATRGAMQADSLAGLWAAKEAVLKALGTGLSVPMTDIILTHSPLGQPECSLRNQAAALARGGHMLISISHEGDMAAAFCVWCAAEEENP